MKDGQLSIRSLKPADAPALSALLQGQRGVYSHFFHPFNFDEAVIADILSEFRDDVYMGMFWGSTLIGFFMLRGWDAGYADPAYGVLIDEQYRGYGLAPLSLSMAKMICKTHGSPRIMLKVDIENDCAKTVFERARFTPDGVEARTGKLIYRFEIDDRRAKS